MTFEVYSYRFRFAARRRIRFPEHGAGNVLRGALGLSLRDRHCAPECPGHHGYPARECSASGSCEYARVFETRPLTVHPSGFSDSPRPFVVRASHLDGTAIEPGEPFFFDINLFESRGSNIQLFANAFADWDNLLRVDTLDSAGQPSPGPITISLLPVSTTHGRVRVRFQTPTDLKGERTDTPDFAGLFGRAQDRVSILRSLYGAGPLDVDFRGMRARAASVRLTQSGLRRISVQRRSSRTGQVHNIGGLVGTAEYDGPVGEFLPYLNAARWTGVGRHCVWGKGEVHTEVL